jgi:hypothetical protein
LSRAAALAIRWKRKWLQHQIMEVTGSSCDELNCKPSEICVSRNSTSSPAEIVCIKKRLLHLSRLSQGRPRKRQHLTDTMVNKTLHVSTQLLVKARKMKKQVHEFGAALEKKRVHLLNELLSHSRPKQTNHSTNVAVLPSGVVHRTVRDASCHQKELNSMAQKLIDLFKQHQENIVTGNSKHRKEKRNSTKKQLHDVDECVCQAMVNWEFQQLDIDVDGHLSDHELDILRMSSVSVTDQSCVDVFLRACDHNTDGALSEKEWCCCFAHVLPPCLAALSSVPSMLIHGQPSIMPGTVVPQCDDDGFYKPVQCDSISGQCWCVDHNGHKLTTETSGTLPSCS